MREHPDYEEDDYDYVRAMVGEIKYISDYVDEAPKERLPFGFRAIPAQPTTSTRRTPMKGKTTYDLVLKALGKKGKTVADIATKLNLNSGTVGTTLSKLVKDGKARIAGTQSSGTGRPSNLYALNG